MTAISLLVSPIWFNLMERVENIANEGLGSYKQALAQAYEDELDGVENVVWAARARYRAARFALYQRRTRRAAFKADGHAGGADAGEAEGHLSLDPDAASGDEATISTPPSINQAAAGPMDGAGKPRPGPADPV